MKEEEIVKEFPKGILNWYPFKKGASVLLLSREADSLEEMLQQQGLAVTLEKDFAGEFTNIQREFDYIVAIHILEFCPDVSKVLQKLQAMLKENGTMLIGMENRLGLRFFCGDRDPFTNRNFDGIEGYKRVRLQDREILKGRNYSKAEMVEYLQKAGLATSKFYSVLPGLAAAQLIYSEDTLPTEDLATRFSPRYHAPDTVFLEEEHLYADLIANGLFHQMANAYLVEVSKAGTFAPISQVTISLDRGMEHGMATIIYEKEKVVKKALYPQGKEKLHTLAQHAADLEAHGIKTVQGALTQEGYEMPFVDAPLGTAYIRACYQQGRDAFIAQMDRFYQMIMDSSEHTQQMNELLDKYREELAGKEIGVCLKKGYWDLVPLNCFYIDGAYVFFDQEFCLENCPANFLVSRMIQIVYSGEFQLTELLPPQFFWERYGIMDTRDVWLKMECEFLAQLRNQKKLKKFLECSQRSGDVTHTNRQRMNFSAAEYLRRFVHVFDGMHNKKVILFGSGRFGERFMEIYAKDYPIFAIIDNNAKKWDTLLHGVPIQSPRLLQEMNPQEYKVVICMKNYTGTVRQLKEMSVDNWCVFDPNMEYATRQLVTACETEAGSGPKKYQVGYVAGVFDLFHIGHLNMLKRAKEQCEYLIVGVVSDEGASTWKQKKTFIPFAERLEIVSACQYVDEAVEIPYRYGGTRDAYRKYHFDCLFSGSDYADNPDWLADREFLRKQGSELAFFPYTESVSSTKLKGMIEKSLL